MTKASMDVEVELRKAIMRDACLTERIDDLERSLLSVQMQLETINESLRNIRLAVHRLSKEKGVLNVHRRSQVDGPTPSGTQL